MKRSILLALALTVSLPAAASAGVYDIHLGGMCSTHFLEGNGNARLGSWPGETSIDAYVDQRDSMSTATVQLANLLNTYCQGSNYCYVYTFSNGGAVLSRTLSIYSTAWNIGYGMTSASNEGGSELGGTGWIGEIFGGCTLAGHIGVSDHRNGWNHNDTHGRVFGMIGGNGWLSPYVQSSVLPGHDDGAVAHHSSGGYVVVDSYTTLCGGTKYTGHQIWWSCEYGSLNHYDLKMKGVCNDGGATGCP